MNDLVECSADELSSGPAPAPASAPAPLPPPAPAAGGALWALPLFLLAPLLTLYWLCPFFSSLTLGNDYPLFSIGAQMQLLFSIKLGTFPLYFPRPGEGFSASGLTLGQLYHPLTWLAGALPGYWSGHALDINTLLRLLSLGLVHYALFRFLRLLRLKTGWALLLSFTAVYNLRMLDSMRYGASLENYTAYLLLVAAAGRAYLRPARPWGFCWIALATYLLVTGGHPQFMYFGFWGVAALLPLLPFYCALFLPEARPTLARVLRFYGQAGAAMAAGCVLASAYLLPYYFDFLRQESGRVGLDYAWACANQDSVLGTLNSFFKPLFSDAHGAFGGSAVILLALCLPLLPLAGVRIPRVIALLWGFLVLTLAYQFGSATPLHYWVWSHVPFAASFRVPGRIAFLNPLTITLLLAWLFSLPRRRLRWLGCGAEAAPYAWLALAAALLFAAYNLWPATRALAADNFSPAALEGWSVQGELNHIPALAYPLAGLLAFATLLLLAGCGWLRRRRMAALLLALAVLAQTALLLRYGSWKELRVPTPTLAEMLDVRGGQFGCMETFSRFGEPLRSVKKYENRFGSRDTRLAALYPEARYARDWDEAAALFSGDPWGDVAVVEGAPRPPAPPTGPYDMNSLTLTFGSFNRLAFAVDCRRAALFNFNFPYAEGRWRATVNGQPAPILRANCLSMGVHVPSGQSVVEFRYFSWTPLISLGISFFTACLLIGAMLATLRRPRLRFALALLTVCLFAGLFILICYSIDHGQGLGTFYADLFSANL